MKRLTKRYPNGNVTLDAAQFGIDQAVLDTEINNSEPIAAAVKRLAEFEGAVVAAHAIIIKSLEQIIHIIPYLNEHYLFTPEEAQQTLKARTDNE